MKRIVDGSAGPGVIFKKLAELAGEAGSAFAHGRWSMGTTARERCRRRGLRRAQVTVEYTLVLVAVLLAIIIAVKNVIQPRSSDMYNKAGDLMNKAANEWNNKLTP
jgi:hypothetical protein